MTRGFPDGFQLNGEPLSAEEKAKVLGEFRRLQERAAARGEAQQNPYDLGAGVTTPLSIPAIL